MLYAMLLLSVPSRCAGAAVKKGSGAGCLIWVGISLSLPAFSFPSPAPASGAGQPKRGPAAATCKQQQMEAALPLYGMEQGEITPPVRRRRQEMERGCQTRRGSTKLMVARAMVGCPVMLPHLCCSPLCDAGRSPPALHWCGLARSQELKIGREKGYHRSRSRSRSARCPAAGREWSTDRQGSRAVTDPDRRCRLSVYCLALALIRFQNSPSNFTI
jgi:hypothetical protein